MKSLLHLTVVCALAGFLLSGCIQDKCDNTITFRKFTPIYLSETEFEQAVQAEAARPIQKAGKIYVQDGFLFVNEVGEGVHLIDNKNPQAPISLAFLRVPGNYDMAYHCGYLYLDSSKDLLIFDIANPAAPTLVQRIANALPHIVSYRGWHADPSKGVVVGWEETILTEAVDCNGQMPSSWALNEVPASQATPQPNQRGVNPAVPGQAGSMSRFAAKDDRLYVVTPQELRVFDVSNCLAPAQSSAARLPVGEGETVFINGNNVFVGANFGMAIFAETPAGVELQGSYFHGAACDPVVVEGDYAYVTLRNGNNNPCDGWTNQLDVVHIANPRQPRLLRTFVMTNPHGLAVQGDRLYLADGQDGLKIFNNSQPEQVGSRLLMQDRQRFGYDVIVDGDLIIMTGKDGIAQFRLSNDQLQLLSLLPVLQ